MKTSSKGLMHPITYMIINFFNRIKQSPEVYPIKYYKKGNRFKRDWKNALLK